MTGSGEGAAEAGRQGRRLAVRRLTLTDFRCYHRLRMETDARSVVLFGPNGAGKTNILEALSFLTPGRGMRRATLSEVARHQAGPGAAWAVAAVLEGKSGTRDVGTGREAGSERRTVRIDGEPAKAGDLADLASALWLTPAMDRIFIEGAGGRRRFLDRLVFGFDPAHAQRASRYEHAMRERTRILKAGGGDPAWLGVLEGAMAENGIGMAVSRRSAILRLDQACRQGIGPFPAARLDLAGEVEAWLDDIAPPEAEDRFKAGLRNARPRDAAAGAATMGPHRTDLSVRHAGKDMPAGQCSTGEQKAVLVSIILAQARVQTELRGTAPLMLLDEVVAHLDATRRAALFDELDGLSAQSWMTGTDEQLFAGFGERAQFFRVADASVHPAT